MSTTIKVLLTGNNQRLDRCLSSTWAVVFWLAILATPLQVSHAVERSKGDELVDAAVHGDVRKLESLLKAGVPANARNNSDVTALFVAAHNGPIDSILQLIVHGADVNAKLKDGRTALMAASENGNSDTIRALLMSGADIAAADNEGQTALTWAVKFDRTDSVGLLLEHGAAVNAQSTNGITPLMIAAEFGREEIVKLLISAQAVDVASSDSTGRTALEHASSQNKLAVARLLIGAGARDSLHLAAIRGDVEGVVRFLKAGVSIDLLDKEGRTPLMLAAANDHPEAIRVLLAGNANINARDNRGRTALIFGSAPTTHSYVREPEVTALLIAGGANLYTTDQDGYTPLTAALRGNGRDTPMLLARGIINDAQAPNEQLTFALLTLGNLMYQAHEHIEAEKLWHRIVLDYSASEEWGATVFNLGVLYKEQKRFEPAISMFSKLFNSQVNDREAGGNIMETYRNYRYRAALEISECHERNGSIDAALEFAILARDRYQFQSGCGTCQMQARDSLSKRIELLKKRKMLIR